MTNPVFSRRHILRNRARWESAFARHDALFNETGAGLLERLSCVKREFQNVLEIGRPGAFLRSRFPTGQVTTADFDESEILSTSKNNFDLAISNLALHGVNDIPGALIQIRRALKPDGFFLASLLGGDTLHELRSCLYEAEMELRDGVSPRVAPFMDIRDGGALLQRAGFALPVAERERLTFVYPDIFALMRELRGMGEANTAAQRDKRFAPKSLFHRAGEIYATRFPMEDGIQATFEIVTLSGWSAHASQQQPLMPGEAKLSLAAALNTRETKTC